MSSDGRWQPTDGAIGNASVAASSLLAARGAHAVGVASALLASPTMLSRPFSPVVRAEVLRRSSLAAIAAALGDVAMETDARRGRTGADAADVQVPPGFATRAVRVWSSLQALFKVSPDVTIGDAVSAVLPGVRAAYAIASDDSLDVSHVTFSSFIIRLSPLLPSPLQSFQTPPSPLPHLLTAGTAAYQHGTSASSHSPAPRPRRRIP